MSDLARRLVAACRATLEEVIEADIVVHVRDAHHPDSEAQRNDVLNVLIDLGLDEPTKHGVVEAMNKIDLLDPTTRASLAAQQLSTSQSVALSPATGEGCEALLELIHRRLQSAPRTLRLQL